MKVTNGNTLTLLANMRADGQQSRADYVELMWVEIDRLKSQHETTLDMILLQIRALADAVEKRKHQKPII